MIKFSSTISCKNPCRELKRQRAWTPPPATFLHIRNGGRGLGENAAEQALSLPCSLKWYSPDTGYFTLVRIKCRSIHNNLRFLLTLQSTTCSLVYCQLLHDTACVSFSQRPCSCRGLLLEKLLVEEEDQEVHVDFGPVEHLHDRHTFVLELEEVLGGEREGLSSLV